MPIGDTLFGIHESALRLRGERMNVLASNIANAATPNYKARDFDFASALKAAEGGASQPALQYRVPLQASLDGNTVELATEQLAFAENAIGYRTSLSFLNSRIGSMMRALKGE
jgi:flagellar basal-body rod protein FlgB